MEHNDYMERVNKIKELYEKTERRCDEGDFSSLSVEAMARGRALAYKQVLDILLAAV